MTQISPATRPEAAQAPRAARPLPWYLVPLAGAVIVIFLPFLGADAFVTLQVMLIAVMSMIVSSLNLSLGYAGELALGQVAVYAVGPTWPATWGCTAIPTRCCSCWRAAPPR